MFDRRRRILLIDDDPGVRDAMLAALDPIRFRVIVAAGVPAAASLCRGVLFDLIICSRMQTLASFRASLRDRGDAGDRGKSEERPVLVLTRDAYTRPWTMTKGVRFARRPAVVSELRDLVAAVTAA